jgi:hypothetical protein
MNLHDERVFIDWVIGVLEAGGLTVGDSRAPASYPAGAGYCVVYSIAGGTTDGTIYDPNDDASPNVQVTSSSTNPDQARWLVAKVRNLLAAAVPATLGDRKVVWLDFPMASVTMLRDDDVQPPRFAAPDRFQLGTVPI